MKNMKTGTTTVGIVLKDGLVLAADKRATMGHLIADKNAEKIIPVTDNMLMTISGMVGDAQMLVKYLSSEIAIYEIRKKENIATKSAATLLANILYGNRFTIPFYVQLLLGGKDKNGFHLFSLLPDGSISKDDFIATGSGSVFSYGILDSEYTKNLSIDEGIKLGVKAVNAGMKRDVFSGDGITLYTLTKKGAEVVPEAKIKKILSK